MATGIPTTAELRATFQQVRTIHDRLPAHLRAPYAQVMRDIAMRAIGLGLWDAGPAQVKAALAEIGEALRPLAATEMTIRHQAGQYRIAIRRSNPTQITEGAVRDVMDTTVVPLGYAIVSVEQDAHYVEAVLSDPRT